MEDKIISNNEEESLEKWWVSVPAEFVLEKSISVPGKWFIAGIASTNSLDEDNEFIEPSPQIIDDTYLLNKRGKTLWGHSFNPNFSPNCIIGKPIKREFSDKGYWVQSELYEWKDFSKQIISDLQHPEGIKIYGQSLEGRKVKDIFDPRKIVKAYIYNIAIDCNPKNSDTTVQLLKSLNVHLPVGLWQRFNELTERTERLEKAFNDLKCPWIQDGKLVGCTKTEKLQSLRNYLVFWKSIEPFKANDLINEVYKCKF